MYPHGFFVALSDAVLIQIIGPVIAFFGLVFQGIMAYLMARLNQQRKMDAQEAVTRADEATRAIQISTAVHSRHLNSQDRKLEDLSNIAKSTHQIVNHQDIMRIQEVERKLENPEAPQTDECHN